LVGLVSVVRQYSTITTPPFNIQTTTSATPTPTQQPVIELSYNINYNATQLPAKYCYYFADQVNKQTNGRVKITVYPSGTLSPPEAVYQSVLTGVADMGQHTVTYTPGQFLALEATHVPYAFTDGWISSNVNTDFVNHFQPASMPMQISVGVAPGHMCRPSICRH
jgi:TRAP-type C4-dicarboxylate transport system substrate-binding protein